MGGGSSHRRIHSGGATDLDLVPLEERGRGLTDPLVREGKGRESRRRGMFRGVETDRNIL